MLHEKPNEPGNWREELDGLTQLPGEALDKAVAWENLQQRFTATPKQKKKTWYWIAAAACFILLATMQWIKENNIEKELVQNTKQPYKNIPVQTIKRTTVSDTFLSKKINRLTLIKKHHQCIPSNKALLHELVADKNADISKATNIENTVAVIPDSSAQPVVTINPPKKQLRVVHINEVSQPIEEKERFAHAPKKQSESGFTEANRMSVSPFNSYSSSDHSLKINLSPNN